MVCQERTAWNRGGVGGSSKDLPCLLSEEDFQLAVCDVNDVVIEAAGRQLSACSRVLEAQSAVFKAKLAGYLAGASNELTEQVQHQEACCWSCLVKAPS